MLSRRSTAGATLVATVCGIALVAQVQAGRQRGLSGELREKVKWLALDASTPSKSTNSPRRRKRLRPRAGDQLMPNGTVFMVVRHGAA